MTQPDLLHHRLRLGYGCVPTSSLTQSTNSDLWRRQLDNIDLDCGGILGGAKSVDACG